MGFSAQVIDYFEEKNQKHESSVVQDSMVASSGSLRVNKLLIVQDSVSKLRRTQKVRNGD